ncbi:MAG: phage tail tape measure protein [Pseudomonadota bacterium]
MKGIDMEEEYKLSVIADTSAFETALAGLEKQAKGFGNTLSSALKSAIVDGESLTDVLRNVALQLSSQALSAGLQPLSNMANSLTGNIFASLQSALPFAQGGVIAGSGYVVSQPSYFPVNGGGMGVAGEAGAEAILPLSRGADGSLGVAAQGNAGGSPVVVNISTPDMSSFQRSEAQLSATVARAVSRGRRSL